MRLGNFQQIVDQALQQAFQQTLNGADKLLESLPSSKEGLSVRAIMSSLLDLAKPYWQRLGLRVVKIHQDFIEIHIPANVVTTQNGVIEEGVLCSAAVFAVRVLWERNSPSLKTQLEVYRFDFERVEAYRGDLRLRAQLPSLQRELMLANVASDQSTPMEWSLLIHGEDDKVVAKIHLSSRHFIPASLPPPSGSSPQS